MGLIMRAWILLCTICAAGGCTAYTAHESAAYEVRVQATAGPESRTTVEDDPEARRATVLWADGDRIGVTARSDGSVSSLALSEGAGTRSAIFEGTITTESPYGDTYYAFYPADAARAEEGRLHLSLPPIQSNRNGAIDAAACGFMVAECADAAVGALSFDFENIFSILKISVTGNGERLSRIVFAGSECERVAGGFTIDMAGGRSVTFDDDAARRIVLDCEGRTLGDEPEAFYLVVPAMEYVSGYSVRITTAGGGSMLRTVGRSEGRVLERGTIYSLPVLAFAAEQKDLSLEGTANCYVAGEAGRYRFDATVIGNGSGGIIAGGGFHTDDASIIPASAEAVWQQPETLIGGIALDADSGVSFELSGQKGNGVIAVRDASGEIVWSWHIWATDPPAEAASSGGATAADRNLGATIADGEGLYYQWGRKDPFGRVPAATGTCGTLAAAVSSPEILFTDWSAVAGAYMWGSGTDRVKTVYDPCPPGWRVAPTSFYTALYPTYDAGTGCAVSGTLRLPFTGYLTSAGKYDPNENYAYYWTDTEGRSSSYGSAFQMFYIADDGIVDAKVITNRVKGFGMQVRCVGER